MDSEALRTFIEIHRTHSFSEAARRLHRSQPAISRRIALLEREIGAPLFERTSGGVALSHAGKVLVPHAERALAALQDAADAVRVLRSGDAGPVSVALVGTLASTALTAALNRFARAFPEVKLALRTATSVGVSDLVRRGEATIGLRYFEDPAADLTCTTICHEELVVVCGRNHRLAGRTVRSLRVLKNETWLAFPEGVGTGRAEATAQSIQAHFLSRGISALDVTPVDSLTAQKRLIEAGFGIALMQQSAIKEERAAKSLATIRVSDLDAANPVSLIVRKNCHQTAASLRLLELLKRTKF
ncbi:MAG TPA: LysR family transcriptional regulator [Pseudomonadales bacterium]